MLDKSGQDDYKTLWILSLYNSESRVFLILGLHLGIRIIRYIDEMIQSQPVAPHLHIFPEPYIFSISLFMPWLAICARRCGVREFEASVIMVFIHPVMDQFRPLQMVVTRRDQRTLKALLFHYCQCFRGIGICAGCRNFFDDSIFRYAEVQRKLLGLCVMFIHRR